MQAHTHVPIHAHIHACTDKYVCAHTHSQGQNQTTQILGSFQAHALNLTSYYLITKVDVLLMWAKGGKTKQKKTTMCMCLTF